MSVIRNIFTSRPEKGGNFFVTVKKIIGFKPNTLRHYEEAITHRSMALQDDKGNAFNYEPTMFEYGYDKVKYLKNQLAEKNSDSIIITGDKEYGETV